MHRRSALAAVLLPLTGCFIPPPPPVPVPSTYDRTFDAALAAATDVGVEVRSADRAAGHIAGKTAAGEVTIDLRRQPNGSVQVEFTAPGAADSSPKLSERWQQAYQRRIAR